MKKLIGEWPKFDARIVTIAIVSTLLILVDYYFSLTPSFYADRLILYFLIPLIIIVFFFKESPRNYGFQLGDWKAGIVITLGAILIIAPILWIVVKNSPEMQSYYEPIFSGTLLLTTFADLFGWEFMFRGWMLFGYERKVGANAMWLQAVPFALAHLTKPAVETLSTIFGGFLFGWVAWRTRSFLYPFLIHWFVCAFTIFLASGIL